MWVLAPACRSRGGVWFTLLAYYVGIFAALNEAGAKGARFQRALMVVPGLAVVLVLVLTGTLGGLGLSRELANGSGDFRAEGGAASCALGN